MFGIYVQLIKRNHILTKSHCLHVKSASNVQQVIKGLKKIGIDFLLFSFLPCFHRTEMFQASDTANGVEGPKIFGLHITTIFYENIEAIFLTGFGLSLGKGQSEARGPSFFFNIPDKWRPAASHIKYLAALFNV